MPRKRRRFSAEFKARVAIEAIKGQRTLAQLGGEHQVHANQITAWNKQLLEAWQEELVARLFQQIGQLKVELDWLKQKSGLDD